MPIIIQNILIIFLAAWMAWDNGTGNQITGNWPVIMGLLSGLILGDIRVGLIIGGTLQLMSLGVAAIGGSSIPEYGVATIVGVFIAIRTGASTGTAIAVGLPVGMLTLELDVVIKIINNFFAHWSQRLLHEKKFTKMDSVFYLTIFVWMLKYIIPIGLVVMFGTPIVKLILHVIPVWFTNGLTIAGGMLPVVGIGMLLRYMPAKKYLAYLLAGFVFAAYLKLPILGIAILGAACAFEIYRINAKKIEEQQAQTASSSVSDDEGDDFDE
ncbi:PTS mannose/fructose/sorbose/N-acetylgalactosamine transporter subunit IIC [Lactobacillus helveticus]|uniref:PTS N-acetylgalactosamine transporter subunit IIA n=1 Tax=Lactobacillus helveticus TaxID=1587 RepID=A0A8H9KGH5_LACHE|nr:PTS sugar transporter subunit IIC [Lactobacillus helveticus]MBW8061827.1 PTS sugar transporter subunit IIC [Lactobacillus helveticus]GFO99931.1 PTS N-acetylgalactosamine transporter subunit IIA [Lactobacillus helveticus]GFP00356.1 PTS N-acetylgalactosamine transporter subunit IIA [Lactobacillus helveticus]GFP03719.1 PTS N-acetylgalactosamine transporter subunit IIA [Lactobacillus helveticus]GFP04103.1 PTS N-acetylgalactosamine transporter subunit IIA [Lactobacillus helveticus]